MMVVLGYVVFLQNDRYIAVRYLSGGGDKRLPGGNPCRLAPGSRLWLCHRQRVRVS